MRQGLSVIIPAYNVVSWIEPTYKRVIEALEAAEISEYEIIIVDDGSRDETSDIARQLASRDSHVYTTRHKNQGRFLTRKVGVNKAKYNRVLFVDARTWIDKKSLVFLSNQLEKYPERSVWNAHINIAKRGNIIARFGDTVTQLGWRRYFKRPHLTSFGAEDFDYYPKGTGLFTAPTAILREAIDWFESQTTDLRNSSDDTLMIRHIAQQNRIWLSPNYAGTYFARTTLRGFINHTFFRGQFFVDGFLRPGVRFYYPLLFFLYGSFFFLLLLFVLAFTIPTALLYALCIVIVMAIIGSVALLLLGISITDMAAFITLLPIFSVVYGIGIWVAVIKKELKK